jgi:outer membrane protein assembly factor BamB
MRVVQSALGLVLLVGSSAAGDLPDLGTRKQGVDWPRFLGPSGDSVSPETGILTKWPKSGLRVVWSKRLGEGYAMPAISRGRAFVFDRVGDEQRLQCLKSETGEGLWTFKYPTDYEDKYNYSGGPRSFPVVDGDRVYTFGPEGMLYCLQAADGKEMWKVDTAKEFGVVQNFFGVGSTPVVEGDLLLVMVGGSPPGSDKVPFGRVKPNDTALVAFDKITGKVRYKTGEDLASYASPVLATINGKRWCFLFARTGLLGVDPAEGKTVFHHHWRARAFESVNASSPRVVGDRIFISETYGPGSALLKVKSTGVEELWTDADKDAEDKSMQCHWMTPLLVDGYLYGCSGRHPHEAELRCIELGTGKVAWRKTGLFRTSLLQVDGHFLCLDEGSPEIRGRPRGEPAALRLIKINPKAYEEVAVMKDVDAYPCWAAPILSHGLLYIRGRDKLVCLELIPAK